MMLTIRKYVALNKRVLKVTQITENGLRYNLPVIVSSYPGEDLPTSLLSWEIQTIRFIFSLKCSGLLVNILFQVCNY